MPTYDLNDYMSPDQLEEYMRDEAIRRYRRQLMFDPTAELIWPRIEIDGVDLRLVFDDHPVCFAAGTRVLMADGTTLAIETIEVGQMVWACPDSDPDAEPMPCRVEEIHHNRPARLLEIRVGVAGEVSDGGVIRATEGHPFYNVSRGWVGAHELRVGDLLKSRGGVPTTVRHVDNFCCSEPVYNLRVEPCHTYFVVPPNSDHGVLVHNASATQPASHAFAPLQLSPAEAARYAAEPGFKIAVDALNQVEKQNSPYAYYAIFGLDKLTREKLDAMMSVKNFPVYPPKGIPGYPDTTALADPGWFWWSSITVSLTQAADATDVYHELTHVLQFKNGWQSDTRSDEATAYTTAQLLLGGPLKALRAVENAMDRGDGESALANWNTAWGGSGFSGMIGFQVTKNGERVQASDLDVIADKLGVVYSASKLAAAYNAIAKQKGLNITFTVPKGLIGEFK